MSFRYETSDFRNTFNALVEVVRALGGRNILTSIEMGEVRELFDRIVGLGVGPVDPTFNEEVTRVATGFAAGTLELALAFFYAGLSGQESIDSLAKLDDIINSLSLSFSGSLGNLLNATLQSITNSLSLTFPGGMAAMLESELQVIRDALIVTSRLYNIVGVSGAGATRYTLSETAGENTQLDIDYLCAKIPSVVKSDGEIDIIFRDGAGVLIAEYIEYFDATDPVNNTLRTNIQIMAIRRPIVIPHGTNIIDVQARLVLVGMVTTGKLTINEHGPAPTVSATVGTIANW